MNVTVTITTQDQKFPAGTVQGPNLFELVDTAAAADVMPLAQKSAGLSAVFANPPTGNYIARATTNGVAIESEAFDVTEADTQVTLQVPATVTVTTDAPAPASGGTPSA